MSINSEKILIIHVSDNQIHYKYFPFYANVWLVRTNNIYTDISDADFELDNIGLVSDIPVISFSVNKKSYKKVDTVLEVITLSETFYYNSTDKTLLIHFENHKPYYYFDSNLIEIGFALPFFNCNSQITGEWNGVQYEPRLINEPSINESKVDIFNAQQIYNGATVEIDNHDLKYKNFNIGPNVKKKNGNLVQFLTWTGEDATQALFSDFELKYQGIIESIEEGLTIKLFLRDIRSSLKQKSPTRIFDTSTFTYIKNPDSVYNFPQVWGECFQVPCLCLNEAVNDAGGSTAYTFMVCDVSTHDVASDAITAVYINGKKTALTPTIVYNTDQNFAYFSIPAVANFRVDDGTGTFRYENMDKVSVDMTGFLKGTSFQESDGTVTTTPTDPILNALAIIREILRVNYGYTYISSYFDLTTWKYFEDLAYDVGYYVDVPTPTNQQIEELSVSQLGEFIWNSDLKFSFDNDDFISFALEIPKYSLFPQGFFPSVMQKSANVLANIRVGIKRKWDTSDANSKYEWLEDNSNASTALAQYNSTKGKDFVSLISNTTDGEDYATRILSYFGISEDTIKIQTSWDARDIKKGDWVRVQLDHVDTIILGWTKCQVLDVNPITIGTWMVELTLRIFAFYPYIVQETTQLPIVDTGVYLVSGEV